MLVNALSRALSARVVLMDLTIGLKGFLGYLKALGGSNVVKVIPTASASGERTNGHKRLKVICGSNTSYLADSEWIGEKTPLTLCQVRVSPSNSIKPNVGASELADTLARILPFVATDDNRPILQCVNFVAKEGKLTLVSADGFRLALTSLDYDDGEGQALVNAENMRGVVSALRRAKRARVSFEAGGETIGGYSLIIDTELIRYKWVGVNGEFPDYKKLIPTEFNCQASFDTSEAIKAVSSLSTLSPKARKDYSPAIDLTIGDGKVVMANPDDKGQAELPADTEGQMKVRLDSQYLAQALRACGGMVEFKLTNGYSPMLFTANGYKLVVMPMLTTEANAEAQAERQARVAESQTEPEAEAEPTEQEAIDQEPVAELEPEAEPVAKSKPKRSRKRVAVA